MRWKGWTAGDAKAVSLSGFGSTSCLVGVFVVFIQFQPDDNWQPIACQQKFSLLLRSLGCPPAIVKTAMTRTAEMLVQQLLERDDIGKLPIPASGKAYSRLRGGIPALRRKP